MRSLLSFWRPAPTTSSRRGSAPAVRFRPSVETLENRLVMDAHPHALPLAPALLAPVAQQATSILPITINNVVNNAGQLVANASLGGTNFQIPLTLSAAPAAATAAPAAAATTILDLHLDPIHLNLLGLKVDTSAICLNISAQPGPGNLLGNLLSDVAGLLNQGTPLSQVLGGLNGGQLSTLTSGLTNLLNGAFGALTSPANAAPGASITQTGTTSILHLSVGPLNLNLLGLVVKLDNCDNGPVTVDVSAQSGPGNLLGNLLGGVAHLLDRGSLLNNLINGLTLPLGVSSVVNDAGQLVANGSMGLASFQAPLTLSTPAPSPAAGPTLAATPVLNLMLGPIHLNLLGLRVDTSPICLAITAQPGPGNLLGNLLSDIAGLLNQGTPLSQILGGLSGTQLNTLLTGLTDLLNQALGQLTAGAAAAPSVAGGTTSILHLSVGPLNLNLLGLMVKLDNCNNGPVTIDVSAQSGPGNLLGNLLTGVSRLLDNVEADLLRDLARIGRIIGRIA